MKIQIAFREKKDHVIWAQPRIQDPVQPLITQPQLPHYIAFLYSSQFHDIHRKQK